MALTEFALTSGSSITNGTSYNTASVSPTANRLVIVAVHNGSTPAASAAAPSGITGAGYTFAMEVSRSVTAFGTTVSLWRGLLASPGSAALAIAFSGTQTWCSWSVFELDGIDTSGSNGSGAFNTNKNSNANAGTTNSSTVTLSSFASVNNGAVMCTGNLVGTTTIPTCTPDTGWSEIHDFGAVDGTAFGTETQWRADNDTTAVGTWSANGGVITVAAEIVAAVAGAGITYPQLERSARGGPNRGSPGRIAVPRRHINIPARLALKARDLSYLRRAM